MKAKPTKTKKMKKKKRGERERQTLASRCACVAGEGPRSTSVGHPSEKDTPGTSWLKEQTSGDVSD